MPGLLLGWVPADRTSSYASGGWLSELRSEGFKLEPSIDLPQENVSAERSWSCSENVGGAEKLIM